MKAMSLRAWRQSISGRPQTRVVITLPTPTSPLPTRYNDTTQDAEFDVAIFSIVFNDHGSDPSWQRQLIDRQISHERLAQLLNSELSRLDRASYLTIYCVSHPTTESATFDADNAVSVDPHSLQQSLVRPSLVAADVFEPWERLAGHLHCGLHCSLTSQWQASQHMGIRHHGAWLDSLNEQLSEQDWPDAAVALSADEWRLLQAWRSMGLGDDSKHGWAGLRHRFADLTRRHWHQHRLSLLSLGSGALLGGCLAGVLISLVNLTPPLETQAVKGKASPVEQATAPARIGTLEGGDIDSDQAIPNPSPTPMLQANLSQAKQALPWISWTKQLSELSLSKRAAQQGQKPYLLWLDMRVQAQGFGLETMMALSTSPETIPDGCRYLAVPIQAEQPETLHQLHCISRHRSSRSRSK